MLATIWKPLWICRDVFGKRCLNGSQFRRALERERLRADRGQSVFTGVFFRSAAPDSRWQRWLTDALKNRLRETDEFGPWDDGMAAMLVGTPLEPAIRVVQSVLEGIPQDAAIEWECFEYPSGKTARGRFSRQVACSRPESPDSVEHPEGVPKEIPDTSLAPSVFAKPLPLWKRIFDIIVAITLLVLTAPILAIAAVAIKLTSPGPVFFRQRRAGLGGKPFVMYKLRTMYVDAEKRRQELAALNEQDGPAFKIRNDPRVTPVGRYLRKTCIDELPQLWNVLRGEMTLVGPRPLPCDESDGCTLWQKRRLDVTPGLTCIWQSQSGKERVPFAEWMRMDLRYVKQRSIWQDIRLLLKTFWAVICHRASQ
ncbi:MAG: spore coat protein CotZ [Pirellulaceae bacterium]|nr:MAG: spore coat protein CotZ [Pirellulaceae bacterium]